MTTTNDSARGEFEEWWSWCSFNSGDVKYACSESWRAAFEAGRRSAVVKLPNEEQICLALSLEFDISKPESLVHGKNIYTWLCKCTTELNPDLFKEKK